MVLRHSVVNHLLSLVYMSNIVIPSPVYQLPLCSNSSASSMTIISNPFLASAIL